MLKAFTAVSALGVTINIDAEAVTGTADTGIFSRDLRRLFVEIGELAREQSVGVVFALDEVHVLAPIELRDLNSALHQTAQHELLVAFIGAGLFPSWQNGPDGPDGLRPSSYPARMVTYRRLEPLGASASREALAGPANVSIDSVIRIVRMLTVRDLIVLDFAPFHPERGLIVRFSMPLLDEYLRTTDPGFGQM